MRTEELLRTADFTRHATTHKETLRKTLFRKERERTRTYELTDEDLNYVTAASKMWVDPEDEIYKRR